MILFLFFVFPVFFCVFLFFLPWIQVGRYFLGERGRERGGDGFCWGSFLFSLCFEYNPEFLEEFNSSLSLSLSLSLSDE